MASFYLDDYRLISVRKSELALTENLKLLVNNIEVKFNISDDAAGKQQTAGGEGIRMRNKLCIVGN